MREGQTRQIIPMFVLVLVVTGYLCVQVRRELDRTTEETQAIPLDKRPAQPGEPTKIHLVRSRFESGPAEGELTFVFDVTPVPESLPKVSWLGATPRVDARRLEVKSDQTGRYLVVLANVPPLADGRLLIEVSDPGTGTYTLHSADFALREHVADRPSSRSSRDGRFVVFTKPEGVSPESRLLIGSADQPLEDLPPRVDDKSVAEVYSVEFLPASARVDGWQLTMAVGTTDANAVLFYLPKGGRRWRLLESAAMEEHSLRSARFEGPGTYLLVRR